MKESKTEIAFLQSLNEGLKKNMKDLREELERLGDGFDRKEKRIGELEGYITLQEFERLERRSGTLRILRKLEWCDDGSGFLVCPCCDRAKGGGHAQDCELDAAIRKGEKQ